MRRRLVRRADAADELRDHANLVRIMNNNLGAISIICHRAADFHPPAAQGAQVSELTPVGSENHCGKRARAVVLTEVEKSVLGSRGIDLQHPALDATGLSHARPSFTEIDTGDVSARHRGGRSSYREAGPAHAMTIRNQGADHGSDHYHDGNYEDLLAAHGVTRDGGAGTRKSILCLSFEDGTMPPEYSNFHALPSPAKKLCDRMSHKRTRK